MERLTEIEQALGKRTLKILIDEVDFRSKAKREKNTPYQCSEIYARRVVSNYTL